MRIKQINPRGWYDIPGYDGKYQINYFGNVRRALKRGYKVLNPYIKTTNGRRVVKLNCKEQVIMKLMQITFIGELPPGMVTYHKNGIITDDALNNIGIITRSELGRLTGRGNGCETLVVKISEEGQIVDFYRSVREAGRKNHMSYQTILDRINGKVKSLYAPDGYVYCKDNAREINKAVRRIELDNREINTTLCDGRSLLIKPDIKMDFRDMPYKDNSFKVVVFDPPHLIHAGTGSWLAKKYGILPNDWKTYLKAGFDECMRVLEPDGVLVFKWNEDQIKLNDVLKEFGKKPLLGDQRGKTRWILFMK